MTAYCLDSSALVKRYVDETGSLWLRATLDPNLRPLSVISHLSLAEMTSAFSRRLREGTLTPAEFARAQAAFQSDCLNEYQIFPVNRDVVDLASTLLQRHPLRTLDALQLGTALLTQQFLTARGLPEPIFISADDRLLAIAAHEALSTDNPLHHP